MQPGAAPLWRQVALRTFTTGFTLVRLQGLRTSFALGARNVVMLSLSQNPDWFVRTNFETWAEFRTLHREFTHEAVKLLKLLCWNPRWLGIVIDEVRTLRPSDTHYCRNEVFAAAARIQSRAGADLLRTCVQFPGIPSEDFFDLLDAGYLMAQDQQDGSVKLLHPPLFYADFNSPRVRDSLTFLATVG
jgi:hypothetical protein